ncbi:unnamed protein product [[Candida] boidinii]|nr:unnamed protein product [[Candida] boidinii]
MSLRLIPESSQPSSVNTLKYGDSAPSAPALHDTLRSGEGPMSISSQINNRHPLESRIANWEETQRASQLEMCRRTFGAADPIKKTMELNIIQQNEFKPSLLGPSSNLHRDILLNKDTTVDWEDIYTGFDRQPQRDLHSEMEKKFGI